MQVIFILLIIALIIYLYFLAIQWFFANAALPVLQAGSVAYTVLILVNYLRAVGEGFAGKLPASKNEAPTPPEPAYKNYFFRKAYLDYSDMVKRAWAYNYEHSEKLFKWNVSLVANPMWFLTWPLTLTFFGVFAVAAIAAATMFGVFGIIHLFIVGIVCIVAYTIALYLRSIEWVSMVWRRINFVCPHSECYKPISLPAYVCPTCGEVHKALVPGSYGIFRRRCKCDKSKLPTLALFGRRKLEAQCPHCSRPLSKEIGTATNIHLPIVGGTSSGKTNYLMATVIAIDADSKVHQRHLSFPEAKDQRVFDTNKVLFEQGRPVAKTTDLSPNSFLVRLVEPSGKSSLFYIYDAAGELYADSADARRLQKYYEYVDGVLFLIDPFSIRQVRTDYAKQIVEVAEDLRPSNESPQDVYDRMITTWHDFSKSKRGIRKTPFAVVITKTDAFDLSKKLGSGSSPIRQWLMLNGEGNLVRSIEKDFDNVNFFASSALGHLPSEQNGFTPRGVLAPAQWLLNHRAVKVVGEADTGVSWKSERLAYLFGILIVTILFSAAGFGVAELGEKLFALFNQSQVTVGIRDSIDMSGTRDPTGHTSMSFDNAPMRSSAPKPSSPRNGSISVDQTGLRYDASETSQYSLVLAESTPITVLERRENGFYKIKLADGSEGFVRWDQVSLGKPSVPSKAPESPPSVATTARPGPKPSPPTRSSASVLAGKWEVVLEKTSSSETRDKIEMTLSSQGNTSLLGNRIYIRGSGGISDKIEMEGSWDPVQRRVELKEHMDSSKPWEAVTRGTFVGFLSEDGTRLEGKWTPYSGAVTTRLFKRIR